MIKYRQIVLDKGGVLGCLRVTNLSLRRETVGMSGFQVGGHGSPPPPGRGGGGVLAALKFGVFLKCCCNAITPTLIPTAGSVADVMSQVSVVTLSLPSSTKDRFATSYISTPLKIKG